MTWESLIEVVGDAKIKLKQLSKHNMIMIGQASNIYWVLISSGCRIHVTGICAYFAIYIYNHVAYKFNTINQMSVKQ